MASDARTPRSPAAKQSGEQYQISPTLMPMRLPGTYFVNSLLWQSVCPHTARTRFQPRSRGTRNDLNASFIDIRAPQPLAEKMGFNGLRNFGYAQAVVAVDNHCFSARHQLAVEQQLHRLVDHAVELDHRSAAQFQHLAQRQLALPEPERDVQLDIHHQLQIRRMGGLRVPLARLGLGLHSWRGRERLEQFGIEIEKQSSARLLRLRVQVNHEHSAESQARNTIYLER